jgi:hypothetical protein
MRAAFLLGLRRVARWPLLLPLYLVGLLLGLLQTWPLWAGGMPPTRPFLAELASGGLDGLVNLALADPAGFGQRAAAWLGLTLVAWVLYGAAYTWLSGGVLSAYAGARPFWAGCWRYLAPYMGLGIILAVLAGLAIAAGVVVGALARPAAGLLAALVLLQLVNLWGEYARAAAVAYDRRNPLALLGLSACFVVRRPGALALGALGLLLSGLIVALAGDSAARAGGTLLQALVLQASALALVAVKQLRLAWALSYIQIEAGSAPQPFSHSSEQTDRTAQAGL